MPDLADPVTITYQAEPIYARLGITSDFVSTANIYDPVDTMNTVSVDTSTGNVLTSGTSNGKFVIPSGVSKVRIAASLRLTGTANDGGGNERYVVLLKNGSYSAITSPAPHPDSSNVTFPTFISPIIEVSQGDELQLAVTANHVLTIYSANQPYHNYFELEVVEGSILNKTVATTLPNAMSITYAPNPIYARLSLASDWTPTNNTTQAFRKVIYDTEDVDTSPNNDLLDLSNSRITIPAGISRIRLTAAYQVGSDPNKTFSEIKHYRNSGILSDTPITVSSTSNGASSDSQGLVSGIIDVQQGDYFELEIYSTGNCAFYGSSGYNGSRNWFEIEVIEGSVLNTTLASTISNTMTVTYAPSLVYGRLKLSSDQTIGNSLWTQLLFNSRDKDTTSGNLLTDTTNSRLTIPAGVDKIKGKVGIYSTTNISGDLVITFELFDSQGNAKTEERAGGEIPADSGGVGTDRLGLFTGIVDVAEGDYIICNVRNYASSNRNIQANDHLTWFEIEVVEGSILNTTVNSTITDLTVGGDLSVTGGELSAPTTGVAATGTDTLDDDEYIYLANDNTTLTLPTPTSGRKYLIKLAGTHSSGVTINTNNTSSVKIDGNGTQTLGSNYAFIEIVSDGSNWFIIGMNGTVTGSN